MQIVSAPRYSDFITQTSDQTFLTLWETTRATLSLDWIDAINEEFEQEKKDNPGARFARDSYSKDYNHDDFPTFWNWPRDWQEAFQRIKDDAEKLIKLAIKGAEKFTFENGDTLYILDEQVWLSTRHYDYGSLTPMAVARGESYDSVATAAYVFVNEYADWVKEHKRDYDHANLLSMRTSNTANSMVGTSHECDGCAAWTRIVFDNSDTSLCQNCFDKLA